MRSIRAISLISDRDKRDNYGDGNYGLLSADAERQEMIQKCHLDWIKNCRLNSERYVFGQRCNALDYGYCDGRQAAARLFGRHETTGFVCAVTAPEVTKNDCIKRLVRFQSISLAIRKLHSVDCDEAKKRMRNDCDELRIGQKDGLDRESMLNSLSNCRQNLLQLVSR